MPPKGSSKAKSQANGKAQKKESAPVKDNATTSNTDVKEQKADEPVAISKSTTLSKKRKNAANENEANKAARRSGRSAPKSQPSQEQLLNYMLSKDAEELLRPDDETEDMKKRGKIRTYSSSVMNPFEELLCAVVLSRPISHRLGLRSIRTLLNDPYNFTSAKAVQSAGAEKRHQALWDARTQHKGKTAEQIGMIADVVLEQFTASGDKDGTQLQKLLDDSKGDVDKALDTMQAQIKGMGATGQKIFLRRVQWLWKDAFPYIDDRTMGSLNKVGLPDDAEELRKLVEQHWKNLGKANLAGNDEAAKKRRAFVLILERAVGADLEDKIDALMAAAAESK